MAKKEELEQPAYGDKQVQDAAQAAANEAQPVTPPGPEAQAVQEALAGEIESEETPANVQKTPVPPDEPMGMTVQNRFNLLPPRVNFQAAQAKTPVEHRYEAGMLYSVLAADPSADPIIKRMAKRALGGE